MSIIAGILSQAGAWRGQIDALEWALNPGSMKEYQGVRWALRGNMESVMVVEDDADIRSTLQDFLKDEGYPVVTAANGKEALHKLEDGSAKPGLVLLDLMMPVMNGWDFLEEKNHHKDLSKIPVLVISAVPGSPSIPGALGFLKKPIDLNRMMDFVELYCA